MNTLNKERTRPILGAEEIFAALERQWKIVVNGPQKHALGPEHHLLYAALRGKDWRRGFAPITNRRKLDNGAFHGWGALVALRRIHFGDEAELLAPLDGVIDGATLQRLRAVLPKWSNSFAIEAYLGEAGHD